MAKQKQNSDAAKQVNAERKKLESIESRLLDINSKISSMTAEQLRDSKESLTVFQQGVALEKQRESVIKKILDLNSKISKITQAELEKAEEVKKLREDERVKYWEKLLDDREELEKFDKKLLEDRQKLKELDKTSLDSLDKSKEAIKELSINSQKILETNNYVAQAYEQSRNVISQSVNMSQNQVALSDTYLSTLENNKNTLGSISDIQTQIVAQVDETALGQYKTVDLSDLENQILADRERLQANMLNMSQAEYSLAMENQQMNEKALLGLQSQQEAMQEMSKSAGKVMDKFESMADSFSGIFEKFPGGEYVGKLIGVDKISKDIKEKLGGSVAGIVTSLKGDGGLVGAFKAAGGGLGSLIKMAPKLALGLGIGAIVAGFGMLVKAVLHADEEIAQMGKDFGLAYKEAKELHHAAIDISNELGMTGINAKEVVEGVKAAGEAFDGVDIAGQLAAGNEEITNFVKQATVLSKQFGLSGKEISNIKDISAITGKSMDELVKESVDLGKGTMTAKQSMQVLSTIPKGVAAAFKGTTKELIAAAQKAKMLGLELGKMQSIGRNMLELETSLDAEMEARVLTGKNINLDAARNYALQGDIFHLQDEILKQAGSMEEFSKMNVLAQESMAKALGMNVDEMTEMLSKAQKLKDADISADYAEKLSLMESAAELEAEALQTGDAAKKDYIMQLAAEKRSVSLKETMASLLEKIKQKFAPIIDAVLEVVGGIKDGKSGLGGFEETLSKIDFASIAAQVKEALPKIMDAVKGLIEKLPKIIEFVTGLIQKISGVASGMGGVLGMIDPTIAGFGAIAFKVAGPEGIVKGLGAAGKAAGSLAGVVGDKLGGAFGKVAKGASGALGKLTAALSKTKDPGGDKMPGKGILDFVNNVNPVNLLAVAGALVLFSAALYITAKAFQEFGNVNWANAWPGIFVMGALVGVGYLLSTFAATVAPIAPVMLLVASAILVFSASLYVAALAFDVFSKVNWKGFDGMFGAVVEMAGAFAVLGVAAPLIILGSLAMLAVGAAAAVFGAGLILIGEGFKRLSEAGDLSKVGQNLADGMTALGSITDKLDLDALEDSFDELEDALDELDFEQLAAFGQLGNSALKGAGENLVAGMNSLVGINTQIDFSKLEDTFDIMEDALAELDLDGVKAFTELAGTDLSNIGYKLNAAFVSLAAVDAAGATKTLGSIEDLFDLLEDALDELDYEDLKAFGGADWNSFTAAGTSLSTFMTEFGKIAAIEGIFASMWIMKTLTDTLSKFIALEPEKITKITESMRSLTSVFTQLGSSMLTLSDAINKINADKFAQILDLLEDTDGFGGIGDIVDSISGILPTFEAVGKVSPQAVTATETVSGGGGGTTAGGTDMAKVEQKLDTLINVINSSLNQPAVIKFGDRVIETIKTELNFRRSYAAGTDNGYGKALS